MQPTQAQQINPPADPHDDIVAILRNERASRPAPDLSDLRMDRSDRVAALVPALDPVPGPPPKNDNRTPKAPAAGPRRGGRFLRFLLTVCFGVAVTVGWQSYGEAARQWLATQVPQLAAILPVQTQTEQAQTDSVTEQQAAPVQATEEAAAPEQPAPAAEATTAAAPPAPAESAAPVQAAPSPDLTPMIEGLSREIVSLRETIEQLKASQQQMGRDLAKAVEKIGEQETRRRTATPAPTPAPRPAAQPARNPAPPPPPPQAAARPQPLMPPPPSTYSPQPYTPPTTPRPPATLP